MQLAVAPGGRTILVLAMLVACDVDDSRSAPPPAARTGEAPLASAASISRAAPGTPSSPLRRPAVVAPTKPDGLAIQGGRLVESLGFEEDGEFVPVLHGGAALPAVGRESFSTMFDDQVTIELPLLAAQEESRSLGTVEIVDIPTAPRGAAAYEIAFIVDEDGRIELDVTDSRSGAPQVFVMRWGAQPKEEIVQAPTPMCPQLDAALREAIADLQRPAKKKRKRKAEAGDDVPFDPDARLREDLHLDNASIRRVLFRALDLELQSDMPVDDVVTLQHLVDESCPLPEASR